MIDKWLDPAENKNFVTEYLYREDRCMNWFDSGYSQKCTEIVACTQLCLPSWGINEWLVAVILFTCRQGDDSSLLHPVAYMLTVKI